MSELTKKLQEKRLLAVGAAREIAERAVDGALSTEDEATYNNATGEVVRLGKLLDDELGEERRSAEFSKLSTENDEAFAVISKRSGVKPAGGDGDQDEQKVPTWRDDARAAITEGRIASGTSAEEMPHTRAEIRAVLQQGGPEQRVLVSTGAAATAITPGETLVNSLYRTLVMNSDLLSTGVRILHTNDGTKIKFPRRTARGALTQTNMRKAEGVLIATATDPTFDQVVLDAYGYKEIRQVGRETVEDTIIDIEGLLGEEIGEDISNGICTDLLSGTGVLMPRGILTLVTAGSQKVSGALAKAGKVSTLDDILTLTSKLKRGYRRNAKFLMSDLTTFDLLKLKVVGSTGENAYAWVPSLAAGGQDTLMGYPVMIDDFMTDPALSALSIVFGDFSKYYVRLVNTVRVEWSTEFAWDTDLISVKAVVRADGDAIDDTAFAGFVGGAS